MTLSVEHEMQYRRPKKVIFRKQKELRAICPSCNRRLKIQVSHDLFCPRCGQKLDWDEKNN